MPFRAENFRLRGNMKRLKQISCLDIFVKIKLKSERKVLKMLLLVWPIFYQTEVISSGQFETVTVIWHFPEIWKISKNSNSFPQIVLYSAMWTFPWFVIFPGEFGFSTLWIVCQTRPALNWSFPLPPQTFCLFSTVRDPLWLEINIGVSKTFSQCLPRTVVP